jgi:hypothetical protein
LCCDVDDFCKVFIPQWQKQLLDEGTQKRRRDSRLTTSEVMTISIEKDLLSTLIYPYQQSVLSAHLSKLLSGKVSRKPVNVTTVLSISDRN